nr:hypothetical protein [Tanacetum cinerariifolium]
MLANKIVDWACLLPLEISAIMNAKYNKSEIRLQRKSFTGSCLTIKGGSFLVFIPDLGVQGSIVDRAYLIIGKALTGFSLFPFDGSRPIICEDINTKQICIDMLGTYEEKPKMKMKVSKRWLKDTFEAVPEDISEDAIAPYGCQKRKLKEYLPCIEVRTNRLEMNCIKDDRSCFFLPSVPAENDSDGPQSNQQSDLDRPQSNQQNDPKGFYNYEGQQTAENNSDRPQSNQQNDREDQETSFFCNDDQIGSINDASLNSEIRDEDQETSPFCNG